MKTQVIQLDPHDDVVSVCDRLGWGRAGRIVLVWPERGHILQRQLDLVLIKRHAQRNGMQIGLVTKDPMVIEHASVTDTPVFEDVLQAEKGRWRGARRRQRYALKRAIPSWANRPARRAPPKSQAGRTSWQEKPVLRAALLATSLLAVLAIFASLLPGATITIQRPENEQRLKMALTAAPQAAAGQFTLRTTTIVVEARTSQPTSGLVIVPEKSAKGSVQFTNLTEKIVEIPAGTIVTTLSDPVVRFMTVRAGKTPAGFGRSTIVDVVAVNPGAQGNIPTGGLQAIEGTLGLSLTTRNLHETSGGSDQETSGPNNADRELLLESTLAALEAQARKEIFSRWQISPLTSDFPITDTLRLDEILEQTYSPAEDWPSTDLSLLLRVSFSADAIAGQEIAQLFETALDSQLAFGQELLTREPVIVLTGSPRQLSGAAGEAWVWEMQASRPTRKTILSAQVSEQSRLLPAGQASRILEQALELQQAPLVQIWPAWWPYLPVTSLRIQVVIAP